MDYRRIDAISRDEAEAVFTANEPFAVSETLVRLAFHDPDGAWVEQQCYRFARHSDAGVRSTAAICLGHLARIHGVLSLETALPTLQALLKNPVTAGQAQDALDDIAIFIATRTL